MFEFISESPPETTFYLGLTTGALLSDTVKRIIKRRLGGSSGSSDEEDASGRSS